jgi:hypothetical protein
MARKGAAMVASSGGDAQHLMCGRRADGMFEISRSTIDATPKVIEFLTAGTRRFPGSSGAHQQFGHIYRELNSLEVGVVE